LVDHLAPPLIWRQSVAMPRKPSAGIVLYRFTPSVTPGTAGLQVLLGHLGGPFFSRKDAGAWTIPKGELDPNEGPEAAARREFAEETGHPLPDEPLEPLGTIRQSGGKTVFAWAVHGDLDPAAARSNTVEIEWPPRSGRQLTVPELDRFAWFDLPQARQLVIPAQVTFLDRLEQQLAAREAVPGKDHH
jgi:predicted NUDIX family NTP pyrophosphohydrolase